MNLKQPAEIYSELTAQGWYCDEFQFDGVWALLIERHERSIVSRDRNRQEAWQTAYQIATHEHAGREELTRPTLIDSTVHGLPLGLR